MRMLTVGEAAECLGVSVSLVYALCARKMLRHERHGLRRGVIRIPEEALDEYRRSVTVHSEQEAVAPPVPSETTGRLSGFTMLDEGRLREAWKGR
jgi:excisionase family DNA binding protein